MEKDIYGMVSPMKNRVERRCEAPKAPPGTSPPRGNAWLNAKPDEYLIYIFNVAV
jgi:hypothetical protein